MPLSAAEQYLRELINRAHLDPLAEAERYGIDPNDGLDAGQIGPDASQVLAHNEALSVAAQEQSTWILDTNTFTHSGENGSFADSRMRDA